MHDRSHYNSAVKSSNIERNLVCESTILQISADGTMNSNKSAMVGLGSSDDETSVRDTTVRDSS